MLLQIMPKRGRSKVSGVLGPDPHPYHRHWQFKYTDDETDGYTDSLDNTDLELCSKKNQIKIVCGSVQMYIGEQANSVEVDVFLPSQVTLIVIQKYGKTEPFCFATVGGQKRCSVCKGSLLKKNPHSKCYT